MTNAHFYFEEEEEVCQPPFIFLWNLCQLTTPYIKTNEGLISKPKFAVHPFGIQIFISFDNGCHLAVLLCSKNLWNEMAHQHFTVVALVGLNISKYKLCIDLM